MFFPNFPNVPTDQLVAAAQNALNDLNDVHCSYRIRGRVPPRTIDYQIHPIEDDGQ
jgi:hypothetical protein